MTGGLTVRVYGTPVPQGSKILRKAGGGRVFMADDNGSKLRSWRRRVTTAWATSGHPMTPGPVRLEVLFLVPRPRKHYGTGRNAAEVKPSAPRWVSVRPDIDKYVRAVCDALTDAGAWEDDSRVASEAADKIYCDDPADAGAVVTIYPLDGREKTWVRSPERLDG